MMKTPEPARKALARQEVQSVLREFDSLRTGSPESRKANYRQMVNDYYDLVTDFYEFGWGQSFHFAPRFKGESLRASIARHEHHLARVLELRPGMDVLDVGCGVGGPMREIARYSGAHVLGVNNNDYQIHRGRRQTEKAGLSHIAEFLKADFMKIPVPDRSYDAVFAIEATCHAPDRPALFGELNRVMKNGAHFAGYEWCMTGRFDPENPEQRDIKQCIEEGDALPDLGSMSDVLDACTSAGFEVLESRDMAETSDSETPWYLPLAGRFSISGFKHTKSGRFLTQKLVQVLEATRVAPQGSSAVSAFLNRTAAALVKGGETGIFTPMFYFHVRKP
jgi:sterol 24-C-methyltransferase